MDKVKHFFSILGKICLGEKNMNFSERLRQLRISHNLTLREVSAAIGLSLMAYAHYEHGDREPSIETLKKLCDYFNVSADYLIGRTEIY